MTRVHEDRMPFRRPTNVSLNADLVDEARALKLNVSRSCEEGLAAAVQLERRRRWVEENREAMESANAWVADHGLPLAKHRMF